MKKKSKNKSNILFALVFLAGLSLLLYPTISNFYNSRLQASVITDYQSQLQTGDNEAHARMISQAKQYNQLLLERDNPFTLTVELQQRYEALLNLSGNGLMGYLEIPCIDCTLPIYHGVEEDVLQQAVGHVEWTSLPVGGESSHCVVSGHRGLPTADLLTHIDRMRIGDHFYLNVLGQRLEYQVDQINVVLPSDTSLLEIEEGKDLVTLLTCTPYGINSHRLLVRGMRVSDSGPVVGNLLLANEVEEVSMVYVLPVSLLAVVAIAGVGFGMRHLLGKKKKESNNSERMEEKTE